MVASKLHRSAYGFLVLCFLIVAANLTMLRVFSLSAEEPSLVYASMFDFMLVIPFLYWFMVLRPRGRSFSSVMAFPLLGAGAVWLMVPAAQRGMVWGAAWPVEVAIVAAELAFIAYEVRIVYRMVKGYRVAARVEKDTMEAWRIAIRNGTSGGKLASVLLHDVSLVYYLLFSWRRSRETADQGELSFTYHKETSQVLYSAIFTKIILMEGIVVHLLVAQWSHWAAWIFTIADLWLLALIWADCRASVLQPVRLRDDRLRLRYGLRIQADIPLSSIASVASAREYHPEPQEMKRAVGPLFGTPNVRIELNRETRAEGFLFLPKQVDCLYLALDEPDVFVRELECRLQLS